MVRRQLGPQAEPTAVSTPPAPRRRAPAIAKSTSAEAGGAPRVSSLDQLVAEILRGLYQGRYVAGQKLTEADLARRFGVGRGTVRDALRRLSADGVVTLSLHRGASIRALSREDASGAFEVLEYLAGLAARLAAQRLSSPRDEEVLADTLTALRQVATAGDAFEFARMRNRFYRLLTNISGNRELARLLPLVEGHLLRTQFQNAYAVGAEKKRLKVYQRIVDAVLAKDVEGAERAMRRHIRDVAKTVDSLPDYYFA